ncbi:MAG: Uma2 family endonuclease [Bacteroidota bacterium]
MTVPTDTQKDAKLKMIDYFSLLGPWFSSVSLSEEAFEKLSAAHPEVILEQEPTGKIKFMSPVHLDSGSYENEINTDLTIYCRKTKSGNSFSPSTGFRLPDGSLRSPDAAFVSKGQLDQLPAAAHKQFARLVPEFIVEIRSDTDQLEQLKKKMRESWIENGVLLAWLIDPQEQNTYIYRKDGSISVLEGFERKLSGEDVLPAFEFDLRLLLDE